MAAKRKIQRRTSKIGKAAVLSVGQYTKLFEEIAKHRHPEKNRLIMQISFKLGLRVQEIALLCIRDVAVLSPNLPMGFKVKSELSLAKAITKGARATLGPREDYERKSVRYTTEEFGHILELVANMARSGVKDIDPKQFYPLQKISTGGKSRILPIEDPELKESLQEYLTLRLDQNPSLKLTDPLVISQKGGFYSPNTLQEHMGLMLKKWGGVERGSSHSGRRSLATNMLQKENVPLKAAQQILGHKDASTTVIYHELPEGEIAKHLKKAGESMGKYKD